MDYDTYYSPDAANNVGAQNQSQKERTRLSILPDAAIFEKRPLHREADHYGKPQEIDVPTVGYCLCCRVESPPQESLLHYCEQEHSNKSTAYGSDCH